MKNIHRLEFELQCHAVQHSAGVINERHLLAGTATTESRRTKWRIIFEKEKMVSKTLHIVLSVLHNGTSDDNWTHTSISRMLIARRVNKCLTQLSADNWTQMHAKQQQQQQTDKARACAVPFSGRHKVSIGQSP